MFRDFFNYGTLQVLTDCPCCTVPEEGKLIKYSHKMSPPPKKGILSFSKFSKSVDNFFMVRYLKSVYLLSSVSCTQGVLTDCLVCILPEECSLII